MSKTPANRNEQWLDGKVRTSAYFVSVYLAVAVGRIQEIFTVLAPLKLGKISLVLALLALIYDWDSRNKYRLVSINRKMLLLVMVSIASVLWSMWRRGSVDFITNDLLPTFFLYVIIYMTAINFATIRFYIFVLVSLMVLLSVAGFASGIGGRTAVTSTYDPNDLALVVLSIGALAIAYGRVSSVPYRIHMIFLGAVGMVSVLSTQSRGGFVGIVVVSIFFLLSSFRIHSKRLYNMPSMRALLGFSILAILVVVLTPEESWDRLLSIFNLEDDYNVSGDSGRLAIWGRGLDSFWSRPYGAGAGVFQSAEGGAGGRYMTAHNSIIQIAVELGVLGLYIFVSLFKNVWTISRRLIETCKSDYSDSVMTSGRSRNHLREILAISIGIRFAIVAFFVTGFFLSAAYSNLFYAILAITAAFEVGFLDGDEVSNRNART